MVKSCHRCKQPKKEGDATTFYKSKMYHIDCYKDQLDEDKTELSTTVWHDCVYVWEKKCWKCKKETKVIHNKREEFVNGVREGGSTDGSLDLDTMKKFANVAGIPYKLTESKTMGESYWASLCIHCESLQGDHHLSEDFFGMYNVHNWLDNHLIYNKKSENQNADS